MFSAREADAIRPYLGSVAWREVILPRLKKRQQDILEALSVDETERFGHTKGQDDKTLRGRNQELKYLISALSLDLATYDYNEHLNELEGQASGEPVRKDSHDG